MNAQYNLIFQKAMVSQNPIAILEVARAFAELNELSLAHTLFERLYPPGIYAFGSAGESRSVADLIDIMAAKDVAIRNLTSSMNEILAGPNASKVQTTGLADAYKALVSRYNDARAIAQKAIDSHKGDFVPDSISTATTEYEHLLDVLNSHWRENTWTPGDWSLEDVYNRMAALGATGVNHEPTPQPKAPTALSVFNSATKAIEGAAKGAGTLAGQAATGLSNQLDWQTILKWGAIVGVAVVLLPHILSMPTRLVTHT